MRALAGLVFATLLATSADAAEWRRLTSPEFGYAIEIPPGFEHDAAGSSGSTARFVDGDVEITVTAAGSRKALSAAALAAATAGSDHVARVTYRRIGRSWFVLSGFQRRAPGDAEDIIFYAKFLFSPDATRVAGFEISYPASRKRQLDAVVERLEDSFRRPRDPASPEG